MRVARSENLDQLGDVSVVETPKDYAEGLRVMGKVIQGLSSGKKVEAMAGGVAGSLDRGRGGIFRATNIPGWSGKPLGDDLEAAFKTSVYLENDSALCGLGEYAFGSGKGSDILAYLTVSTGVGGARIVGGKIDVSLFGFEPGHQIVDTKQYLSITSGLRGELEEKIGGYAILKNENLDIRKIPQDNNKWDELSHYLSVAIYNTAMYWSPDTIVVGGSMIVGDPCIDLEASIKEVGKLMTVFPAWPMIRKAELGDKSGLLGSMAHLKQMLSVDSNPEGL